MCAVKLKEAVGMRCMLPLCPFAAIVYGLMGCGTRSSATAEGLCDASCQ